MNRFHLRFPLCGTALLASLAALSPVSAEEQPNYLTGAFGYLTIDGSDAAVRQRLGLKGDFYGGLDAFHMEQLEGGGTTYQIDGRAIFDEGNYKLQALVMNEGLGSLEIGYKAFRTWYNGNDGFFRTPANAPVWLTGFFDPSLALDREEFKVALTYQRNGEMPKITLGYRHLGRDGEKNSTVLGDTAKVGLGTATRNIVPAYYEIDEKRDIFTLDIEHLLGETKVGGGLRYEQTEYHDSRNNIRRPGESSQRFHTQRENYDNDLFAVHGFVESRLNEQFLLTTAASYTNLDGELTGSRIYGETYDPAFSGTYAGRQYRDHGFIDLIGTTDLDELLYNASLLWQPSENWAIVPSFRLENLEQSQENSFADTEVDNKLVMHSEDMEADAGKNFTDLTAALEARYTGLKDVVVYGKGLVSRGWGDLEETEIDPHTNTVALDRLTDFDRDIHKVTGGVNWYVSPGFKLIGQAYYKFYRNEYEVVRDSIATSSDRYPSFIRETNVTTRDMNLRAMIKLAPNFSAVTRAEIRGTEIESAGQGTPLIESANYDTTILSQTLSWSPAARLFLQGSVSYVQDEVTTPANDLVDPAPPSTVKLKDTVQVSQNDYWTFDVGGTFIVSEKTDLNGTFIYYLADNFSPNYAVSVPYGAGLEEYGFEVSLTHRFAENLIWTVQYGLYDASDETSGKQNDYTAQAISTKLQYRY